MNLCDRAPPLSFLILIAIAFPHLSPVPISLDIQPVFIPLIILWFALLVTDLGLSSVITAFSRLQKVLIILSLTGPLLFLMGFADGGIFKDAVRFLMAALLIEFGRRVDLKKYVLLLIICLFVHLLGLIIHYLAPTLFIEMVGSFIRIIKISHMSSSNGPSGFFTEPGLAAGVCGMLALLVFNITCEKNKPIRFLLGAAGPVLMICALTSSGLGLIFFYLNLFLFIVLFSRCFVPYRMPQIDMPKQYTLFASYWLMVAFGIAIVVWQADLILKVSTVVLDHSSLQRLENIIVGVLHLKEAPFGLGYTDYGKALRAVTGAFPYIRDIPGTMGLISALAGLLISHGILAFLLLYLIGEIVYLKGPSVQRFALLMGILICLLSSFSIVLPILWVAVGWCLQPLAQKVIDN